MILRSRSGLRRAESERTRRVPKPEPTGLTRASDRCEAAGQARRSFHDATQRSRDHPTASYRVITLRLREVEVALWPVSRSSPGRRSW